MRENEDDSKKIYGMHLLQEKGGYGFGQSMVWYAAENQAKEYIVKLIKQIDDYCDENWIDVRAEDIEG